MFTDRWHTQYDHLPEPKRTYMFFGIGIPAILLATWNVFIGVPLLTVVLWDRYRFLKKHGAI